jgi:ATP-dependent DNA helicase RecQ
VLLGKDTEKVKKWGHEKLSTFGIGSDLDRAGWLSAGRELLRIGCLQQGEGEFPVLELTDTGMDLLRTRKPLSLTKPSSAPKAKRRIPRAGAVECDDLLLARLKALRKKLADQKGVPAYVIFGDATLRQLAREYPEQVSEMENVFGMGEKKREAFGQVFADEIRSYLENNSRVDFGQPVS